MNHRRWGLLTVVALVASTLVSFAMPAPARAATAQVPALVAINRVTLLNTSTGVGAPKGPLRAHRWATFTVPSGAMTVSGRHIVLTVNISSPTASGGLGLSTTRTSVAPATLLSFAARTSAGTTALRAASSAHTLSVYNNSNGSVQVAIVAIGYTQSSPTEVFHATSHLMLKGTSLARGVWMSASAIGGTVPPNATTVLARLAMTGRGVSGAITVATAPTSSPPTTGQYSYAAGGVTRTATIRRLGRGGRLYFYNLHAPSVTLTVTVVGYVTPAGVGALKATSTRQGQVTLAWSNPPNTSSVVVRRSDTSIAPATPTSGTAVPLSGNLTSAIDTTSNGLSAGRATYSVFTTTPTGTSSPTVIDRPGPPVPTPTPSIGYPESPGCNPSPGEVNYTWNQSGAVDHYIVSLSSMGGGVMIPSAGNPPQGISLPGTARSYRGTGLQGRGEYGLTVYALDSAGNYLSDLYIDCLAGDGTDQAPGPVSGVTGTASPSAVTLNWTNAAPHVVNGSTYDGYVAISRTDGNAGSSTPNGPTVIESMSQYDDTSVTDPTVRPGRTYTYSIWSMTSVWTYGTPVSFSITTPTGNSPSAVAGLTAQALPPSPTSSGQSIRLSWTAPQTNPAGYLIARSIGTAASPTPVPPSSIYANGAFRLSGATTSYTDAGLPTNTTVAYSVWAIGSDGSYSSVSTASTTTDPGLPRAVSGRLFNSASGVTVAQSTTITFTSGARTIDATVSSTGTYSVQLPVDVYQTCVDDTSLVSGAQYGYFRTCTPLTIGAGTHVADVPVDPMGAVVGTITDPTTGKPVMGASVSMPDPTGVQTWPFVSYIVTTSAADGTYELVGAKAGTAPTISVSSPMLNGTAAYTVPTASAAAPTVPAGKSVTQDFTMTKLPTITVSGTVTRAAGGTPVAGVTVYIGSTSSSTSFSPATSTTTAADGTYSKVVALQPSGSFEVCIDAETSKAGLTSQCYGGADFDTTAAAPYPIYGTATAIASTQTANVALEPMSTISGRVVGPTGVGIAGAAVTPWIAHRTQGSAYTTTTDASGNYTVHTPLAADMTNLQPRICADAIGVVDTAGPGGYLAPSSNCSSPVSVSTAAPTSTTPVSLTVPFAAGVGGIVTDPVTGAPLAGVHVTLTDKVTQTYDSYPSYTTTTDASGRYIFAGLDPNGVNITVAFDAYASPTGVKYAAQTFQNASPSNLTLTAGQLTSANMPLARAATLAGTVTDAATDLPVAGVTITSAGNGSAVTDASGHYAITGVAPGNANVAIDAVVTGPGTGYQPVGASVTAAAGSTTTLNISLQPAAELAVRVVAPDGRPVPGVTLSFWSAASFTPPGPNDPTGADGYVRFRGIVPFVTPLGTICAHSSAPGPGDTVGFTWGCARMMPLTAGKVSTVVIVVGYDGRVGALVYDKTTGEPVSGATVSFYAPADPASPSTGTTVNGFTFGNYGLPTTQAAGPLPNPINAPDFRFCAQAPGYAPACADDDSSDGTSGTIFSPSPAVATVATIGLAPN